MKFLSLEQTVHLMMNFEPLQVPDAPHFDILRLMSYKAGHLHGAAYDFGLKRPRMTYEVVEFLPKVNAPELLLRQRLVALWAELLEQEKMWSVNACLDCAIHLTFLQVLQDGYELTVTLATKVVMEEKDEALVYYNKPSTTTDLLTAYQQHVENRLWELQ